MSSDPEDMENGVPSPFGKITVQEIPTERKEEDEGVRSDMLIDDGETLKNELVEDKAHCT